MTLPDQIDEARFDEIVTEHRGRVQRVVANVISDPDLAADVVQETFIRAWRGLARFRGEAAIGTWLHRIAINTALTARRRALRLRGRTTEIDEGMAAVATADSDPERGGEMADLRRVLREALDSLPSGQRAVVVLKDVEGWSHAEIAEHLGISESAAKVRLHRAHLRLASLLEVLR